MNLFFIYVALPLCELCFAVYFFLTAKFAKNAKDFFKSISLIFLCEPCALAVYFFLTVKLAKNAKDFFKSISLIFLCGLCFAFIFSNREEC